MSPAGNQQHEYGTPEPPAAPVATGPEPVARRAPSRRWRSPWVAVGAVAVVVGGLAIAGTSGDDSEEEYDYDAVCVDDSDTRVEDERCDDAAEDASSNGSGGGHWYFIPVGGFYPRLGARATGGTSVAPDPARFSVHRGGADPAGGTVTRGGFGGRGDGSVGG